MIRVAGMRLIASFALLALLGFLGFVSLTFSISLMQVVSNQGELTELSLCDSILNASSLIRVGNIRPVILM